MLTDMENSESGEDQGMASPALSERARRSSTHLEAASVCKKFRSKSVVSVDPKSPYYTSRGQGFLTHNLHRAPTVSCVPGYDQKSQDLRDSAQKASRTNGQVPGMTLSPNDPKAATIRQHYYPEGGWGWVVCVCAVLVQIVNCGLQLSYGFVLLDVLRKFSSDASLLEAVCLGAFSTAVTLFLSPVVVAMCRRKSVRLTAVLGGLVTALGCLFTSFASQFHQVFLSYGIIVGGGVSMTRETSVLMVGQYFKKKRELVEIIIFSGTGLGLSVMPLFVTECIRVKGWRLGLQAVTGVVFLTFIVGIFYRSASLYHPQRRAILHMKSLQKRSKAKDKNIQHEKPPFFDFTVFKSRTVQILVCGAGLAAFGVHTPLVLLIYQGQKEGLDYQSLLLLQVFLGLASALGSSAFGFVMVKNSVECMIARQYLCQAAAFMVSASLLAFTALDAYSGYVLFVWLYGLFYGGYQYSLKMFTFEKVRARNFARAWGFVQWSQAVPHALGVPLASYMNEHYGDKTGFYLSSAFVFLGSSTLFLIDIHKRKVERRKMGDDERRYSDFTRGAFSRRSSFQDSAGEVRNPPTVRTPQRSLTFGNYADLKRQELTCISEEVIMDNYLDDYLDDITSCNKEEKYLMLSEFENNLNQTQEVLEGGRRLRPFRKTSFLGDVGREPGEQQCPNCMKTIVPTPPRVELDFDISHNNGQMIRPIDVIEEVTTSL